MGWVDTKYDYQNQTREMIMKPYKSDMNIFKVVKVRQPCSCAECNSKIPKASYVWGSGWVRLCLGCGEKFSLQGIKALQEVIAYIQINRLDYFKNKDKWEANNTLAKL